MLKNITKILLYCYVENHFYIKNKENMQRNTDFPRTCSLCRSLRFVRSEQGGGFVCGLQSEGFLSNTTPNETAS